MEYIEHVELDTKQLANKVTVSVKLKNINQWRVRIWIGTRLMRLAALIMWVDIEIEE